MAEKPTTTDEYLATLTDEQRATLVQLRESIRATVPGAGEGFSYGMPAFTLGGRAFLWFAAWKRHYSLYPIGPAILAAHASDIVGLRRRRAPSAFLPRRSCPTTS